MFEVFHQMRWQDAVDIGIIACAIYWLIHMIKGTRAMQMVIGLVIVLLAYIFSQMLGLFTFHWIMGNFLGSIILVIIVIFQSDIRRALTQVGTAPLFSGVDRIERDQLLEELSKSVIALSNRKIGGLIALEREVGLNDYVDLGTHLDARLSRELIESIFLPSSPIHDGALIIQNGRITAAGCFLPLSVTQEVDRNLGARHRAAVGLTEESDAVVVIVSEENGGISLATDGKVVHNLNGAKLRSYLGGLLG